MEEELRTLLDEVGDNIGDAMAGLRQRLMRAREAGDEDAAMAAELLYLKASQIQHQRNQIVIGQILASTALQDLLNALRQANKTLKDDIASIADLTKKIGKLKAVLAKVEAVISKLPALLV